MATELGSSHEGEAAKEMQSREIERITSEFDELVTSVVENGEVLGTEDFGRMLESGEIRFNFLAMEYIGKPEFMAYQGMAERFRKASRGGFVEKAEFCLGQFSDLDEMAKRMSAKSPEMAGGLRKKAQNWLKQIGVSAMRD